MTPLRIFIVMSAPFWRPGARVAKMFVLIFVNLSLFASADNAQGETPENIGAYFSVEDAISYEEYVAVDTELVVPALGRDGAFGQSYLFSPSGDRALFLTLRGDHDSRQMISTLYVVELEAVEGASRGIVEPRVIVSMGSSSNTQAISRLKWISDTTIAFVAARAGEQQRLMTVDMSGDLRIFGGAYERITGYDFSENNSAVIGIMSRPASISNTGNPVVDWTPKLSPM